MKRYIFIIAALTALIFTGCSNDDDRPVKTPIDPLTDIYGVVTQGSPSDMGTSYAAGIERYT